MGIKAREVGDWLRQHAGKRNHRELMPEDYVVLRPGPNFHWLMSNSAPAEPPRAGLERENV
jgi:hypothetical protein